MKIISICIPCYNEELNIVPMYKKLLDVLSVYKNKYNFEIIFADNSSTDNSRSILRLLASEDKRVKAIFNTRNFGPVASNRNSILSASGDAVITIVCDFQDPPQLLPEFITLWEQGNLVVCGQKVKSKENILKKCARSIYYKIIKHISEIQQYEQVTGFALYDRSVIEDIRRFDNANVALRHVLSYIGYPVRLVPYEQPKRRAGKSSYSMAKYFDFALTSLINTSFKPIRIVTILGMFASCISFLLGVIYFIYKLLHWNTFPIGIAPLLIGIFLISSIILFFLGLIGEYIIAVLKQTERHPSVFELERLNFDQEESTLN